MPKQLQWAIGGLALLIVGFVAFQIYLSVDMKRFKEELADPEPKTETETEQPSEQVQVPEVDNRPPRPDDGRKYVWHEDHWHEMPVEQQMSFEAKPTFSEVKTTNVLHVRGFTSTNSLFSNGVPEHLQCPKELVGVYTTDVEDLSKIQHLTAPRALKILTKYNPKRTLTEVWPEYIEAERFYYENRDVSRAEPGSAGGRVDWQFQHLLDYPEITVLHYIDSPRSSFLRQVLIGHKSSDWNQYELSDKRMFYAGNDYNYEFIYEETFINAEGIPVTVSSGFGFGHAPTSDIKRIMLAQTTDEELKGLGGWNYNIDPYSTGLYTLPSESDEQLIRHLRSALGDIK